MANTAAFPSPDPGPRVDRLFRGLVQCGRCFTRRLQETRWGDVLLLRRDGTVELHCPRCGSPMAHRLVRMGP